jgi:hypothetical protein
MIVPATSIAPRVVRVTIGVSGAPGLLFEEQDIDGTVRSYKGSKPNEGQVTIHNLSKATIAQLEKPNQVMRIEVGTDYIGQLFIGSVVRRGIVTKNDIPNRQTRITARDGRRVYRDTRVAVAYPPNVAIAQIVQDLLVYATRQGIALGLGSEFPPGIYPDGWAFQGQWRQALDEILEPEGYYWTIQGGVIYVINEASTLPGNVPLISPDTGLTGSPTRTDKGCDYESILNPAIIAGRPSQITSQFFNGLYRNVNVTQQFSNYGGPWATKAQSEVIK